MMKETSHQASEASEVKNPGGILSAATLAALTAMEARKIYPEGYEFYAHGQSPEGIYILYAGKVRLCVNNDNEMFTVGETLPGDILGLTEVVLGKPCKETAEAVLPCRAGFIASKDFLHFLDRHREAAYWVVQLLSDRVTLAFAQLSTARGLPCRRPVQ